MQATMPGGKGTNKSCYRGNGTEWATANMRKCEWLKLYFIRKERMND